MVADIVHKEVNIIVRNTLLLGTAIPGAVCFIFKE